MKTLDESQLQGICRTCGRKYRCKDALRYLDMQGCNQYEVLTNEEWLNNLNTEQLAWFIAKAMLFYDNTTMSLLDAIKKAMEYDKKASDHFTDDIVEWLKQPHKE